MSFPFVSRERLNEALERIASLEAERKLLLDRIALMRGEPPMFAPVAAPAPVQTAERPPMTHIPPAADAKSIAEPKKIVAGSVTADYILAKAAEAVKSGKIPAGTR